MSKKDTQIEEVGVDTIQLNNAQTRELLMVQNSLISRMALAKGLLDPRRDLDIECGYPKDLTIDEYVYLYRREGVAERVVNIEPEESWCMDPIVHDTELPNDDSKFNDAFDELQKTHRIWHYLERADILSGIGHFGVLLVGLNDGLKLHEEVPGRLNDKNEWEATGEHKVIFLRAFDESLVEISSYEKDPTNPRFGLPTMYNIKYQEIKPGHSSAVQGTQYTVHWTRLIHLADNRTTSEVCGTPRMEDVYNRLADIRKVAGGSAEMYWKGAFPGLSFETTPDIASDAEIDSASIKTEVEAYMNGLKRYVAMQGISAKSLAPQVSDPTPQIMVYLKLIAVAKGVPMRIFMGTEEAKLAGSQDATAWNKRIDKRRKKYLNPMVIGPFINMLINYKVLPEPDGGIWDITWPDLDAPSDKDKAEVAKLVSGAIKEYVLAGADTLIPPMKFLTLILGYTEAQAEEILDEALDNIGEGETEEGEEEAQ